MFLVMLWPENLQHPSPSTRDLTLSFRDDSEVYLDTVQYIVRKTQVQVNMFPEMLFDSHLVSNFHADICQNIAILPTFWHVLASKTKGLEIEL